MDQPQQILKKAREARGLTQEALATQVGISHRMMQRYEEGQFPKYKGDRVKAIDAILGTKIYDIIYATTVPHGTPGLLREQAPVYMASPTQDYTAEYIGSLKDQLREAREVAGSKDKTVLSELSSRISAVEAILKDVLAQLKIQAEWLSHLPAVLPAGPLAPLVEVAPVAGKAKGNSPAVVQRVYSGKHTRQKKSSVNKR